jgi:peptidylprolyl isomerase
MTLKLPSFALLAAMTTAATAQTTPTPKPPVTHHTAAATTSSASSIPKVVGLPKTLYALKYVDIKIGTGALAIPSTLGTSPADSKVMQYKVRYTGWLTNGTKFDSSDDHPNAAPLDFMVGLHRVIAGWDTGFTGMHVGGKRRLFIPWQLAYGEAGKAPIPPRSNLIFDIELVSQEDITSTLVRRPPTPAPATPKPDSAPANPATPPVAPPSAPPATPPPSTTPPATPPHPETR